MATDLWEVHRPGGETVCSGETPYLFYTRRTNSANLLIFFQPGGAKLLGVTDDGEGVKTFDPSIVIPGEPATKTGTAWDQGDSPTVLGGIFDLADERNPFADYNMVFVAYCTGDAHLGNAISGDTHHKGFVNTTTVLDWTFANIPVADRVVIMGSSAGGLAAPFYAGPIARHYGDTEIIVLADSCGSYRASVTAELALWGAVDVLLNEFGDQSPSAYHLNFETSYLVNGQRYPHIRFAQFNTTGDVAQQNFIKMITGQDPSLPDLQQSNHADIRKVVPHFATYTATADYHIVLTKDRFYEETVDGIRLYEWVRAVANGNTVPNVGP